MHELSGPINTIIIPTFIFCLNKLNIRYTISKHCKMTTLISKICMIKFRVQHIAK